MSRASRFVWIKIEEAKAFQSVALGHELRASCGLKYYPVVVGNRVRVVTSFALRVD